MTRQDALTILEGKGFYQKTRREYNSALEALKNPGKKIRCAKNTGSGRYASSVSWLREVLALFDRMGFKGYSWGNDAPKNGRCGDFIIVNE